MTKLHIRIKEIIKKIIHADRFYFYYVNMKYGLDLDYARNAEQVQIFKEVFYHKVYELGFPKGIENGIIVDIGAHYGYFSIYSAKNIGSNSKIYAIEPSEDNYNHFIYNVDSTKLNNIRPFQIAISGISTERNFYTAKSWNHSLFENYLDHMEPSTKVQCLTLADFMKENIIEHIDFLKIDCEGAEHEILQNSNPITLKKIRMISMEIHDMNHCGYSCDKTMETLKNVGFEILYSDYDQKKRKIGFNAKVVLQLKAIN